MMGQPTEGALMALAMKVGGLWRLRGEFFLSELHWEDNSVLSE